MRTIAMNFNSDIHALNAERDKYLKALEFMESCRSSAIEDTIDATIHYTSKKASFTDSYVSESFNMDMGFIPELISLLQRKIDTCEEALLHVYEQVRLYRDSDLPM